jgi:hypothetical protein
MSLSYQEKSICGSLIATLVVYGRYFLFGGGLIETIVLLVVIQILCQIAIAVLARPEPRDERDRLIEMKGYRVGYLLLVTGIIACMTVGLRPTVDALLLALVVAETGSSITQLYYYRRGV